MRTDKEAETIVRGLTRGALQIVREDFDDPGVALCIIVFYQGVQGPGTAFCGNVSRENLVGALREFDEKIST